MRKALVAMHRTLKPGPVIWVSDLGSKCLEDGIANPQKDGREVLASTRHRHSLPSNLRGTCGHHTDAQKAPNAPKVQPCRCPSRDGPMSVHEGVLHLRAY